MLNDLFRTYKKIIILVLIVLCMVIFWFYGCHRQQHGSETTQIWEAEEMSEAGGYRYHFQTDALSGNVVFGTKGYIAQDRTVPVRVSVSCEDKAFTGTLKITLPGADGEGVSYQSALSCREGVTSKVSMEIPSLGNASYFYFEILDSFGTVQFSERVLTRDEDEKEAEEKNIYIGVLSSQYSSLEYLDGMSLDVEDENLTLKLVRFLAGDFPTDVQELGSLSGILIDSFDTSSLSQLQIRCLSSWVSEGGSLFVGTGTGAEVVLPSLEKMLKVKAEEVEEVQYSFTSELSRAGSARLYSSRLILEEKDEWESLSFSSPACVYRKEYDSGEISVFSFSLTDDTFRQWTGRDAVIGQIFEEELNTEVGRSWADDTSLWYVKRTLYAFMNGRRLNTFYYGVFFIVYLGVLGFFAYYLLRKIKRREYIWGVVPVVAILFTVSLAFRSEGSSGETGEGFSAIRVSDAEKNKDDYFLLYQSSEGTEDSVDLVSSISSVEPVDYDYRTENVDDFSVRNITENYTINNTKNGFDIAFGESVPGTSYILKCSGSEPQADYAGCFSADITAENSYFEGNVTNLSDWNFEKVVLIRGQQYTVINGMEPGETAEVKESAVRFWTEYEEDQLEEEDDATAVGSLVEYLKQRYMLENQDQDTLLVIGITDENNFQLLSNGNTLGNRLSAFVNRFELPKSDDSDCIININTCLDEESGETSLRHDILEKNEMKAVYAFDPSKLVWGLFRNRDGFEGAIYAYNYDTGEQERILEEEDDFMNCDELEPYISDMNEMMLTYTLPAGSNYGEAPVLSLLTKDLE